MSFGLTLDKLLLLALLAALVVGPERMPVAASRLADLARGLKALAEGAKQKLREEMGPEFDDVDWNKLDPRQYDPRRIVRDALRPEMSPAMKRPTDDETSAPRSVILPTPPKQPDRQHVHLHPRSPEPTSSSTSTTGPLHEADTERRS